MSLRRILLLSEKPIIAPIKDSTKNFNLLEYLEDEVTTIYLNDDLSLGEELKADSIYHNATPTLHKNNKNTNDDGLGLR